MTALRIMVVEDEALIAMLLAEVLGGMGHEVCAIEATEAGAVASALRCRPDLMLVDARLRDGSGVAAVDRILATVFIAHIFVTGETVAALRLRPGTVVLQKPFRESDLVRAMDRALGVNSTAS